MATLTGRTILSLALGAVLSFGCASTGSYTIGEIAFEPLGPGATFATIEDAAVDGLAYSYLMARSDGNEDLMYGGKVRVQKRGYTYGIPVSAIPQQPKVLRTTLTSKDVARFHVYPRVSATQINRLNERVSRSDRASIDRRDPGHRPLFVLTPRLSIVVYRGRELPSIAIASLRPVPVDEQLAGQ